MASVSSPKVDRGNVALAVVLITRPEPGATETAIRLASLGLVPLVASLFSIRQLGYPAQLPSGIKATLLTSRNAVLGCPPSCHDLVVFAVGDATASCAADAGFKQINVAAGDAVALGTLVSQTLTPADGTLFLPVGRRQGGGLAGSLRQKGFRVLRHVVYETSMVQTLPVAAETHLRHGQVRTVMFFSAEAARHFVHLVHAVGLDESVHNVEAVSISERPTVALGKLPWRRISVAEQPNQDAMLALLK